MHGEFVDDTKKLDIILVRGKVTIRAICADRYSRFAGRGKEVGCEVARPGIEAAWRKQDNEILRWILNRRVGAHSPQMRTLGF